MNKKYINRINIRQRTVQSWKSLHSAGFTLIEIMVALVIGMILIAGMVTVLAGNKISSDFNNALIDIQESSRFALDSIARDARMAGFQGCIDINKASVTVLATGSPTDNLFESAVTGSVISSTAGGSTWDPDPPDNFTIPSGTLTPVADTHTLSLQFGNQQTYQISTMTNRIDDIVVTSGNVSLDVGDLAIISNCQSGDLFEVTAINQSTIKHQNTKNTGNALSMAYGQSGERNMPRLMKFEANIYFVADSGRTNESGDSVQSLYRQTLPFSSSPQEMIEGVEQFRVKYGVREEDSDNMSWVTADQVGGDFSTVESIQLGLLISSKERVSEANDSSTYRVAGDLVVPDSANATGLTHPGDTRLRQAFNTTISIRNRR